MLSNLLLRKFIPKKIPKETIKELPKRNIFYVIKGNFCFINIPLFANVHDNTFDKVSKY